MAVFNSNGTDIAYIKEGAGRPVMLVHGFASTHKINWGNTGWINKLIKHGRQVVALDLRGHGQSSKYHSPSDYYPHLMGEDVVRLMDHLEIERADLVGYSMGAWVSAHLLILYPDRFNAVVLAGAGDTLLDFDNRSERIAQALATPYPDDITHPFLRTVREFAELTGNDLRALAACARGVNSAGIPELGLAERPVLLITGEADDVVGRPDRFAEMIPGAQTIMVPSCDHLTALTQNAFKMEVIKFLDRYFIK